MATSRWRDWQPGQTEKNIQNTGGSEPTKPTEPGFDGFDGSYPPTSGIFSSNPAESACRLLNSVEARLWLDAEGNGYVGIWECVDSEAVRQAAALVFPSAKMLHLERPEVPLRLKVMSKRIANIEDACWKKERV